MGLFSVLAAHAMASMAVRFGEFALEFSAMAQWCVGLGRTSIFRRGTSLRVAAGQLACATDDEVTMPSCADPHSYEPVVLGLYM